jgi:tetratricopeptide (TPR) repeat protein
MLYESRIAPTARRSRATLRAPERAEIYRFFAGGALLLGVAASRRGWHRFSVVGVVCIIVTATAAAPAPVPDSAAEAVKRGNDLYAAGAYQEALIVFERAAGLEPASPLPIYNCAATLFQLRRYRDAETQYRRARALAGEGLRTKIDFALGNVSVELGEYGAALRWYDSCLDSKVPGLVYAAIRRDAAINRAYAARNRPPADENESGRRRVTPAAPQRDDAQEPRKTSRSPESDTLPELGNPRGRTQSVPDSAPQSKLEQSRSVQSGSPEDELDDALRNARAARQHRLTDAVTSAPDKERKDW